MGTVHFGRLLGEVGFARTVAIKRLHPAIASDPDLAATFIDEARMGARIHHPNVVQMLDVVAVEREIMIVMEYVGGESCARLLARTVNRRPRPPFGVISTIVAGVLHGLHAAHEAKSERGEALELVHRDVSPQNILVGSDGVARVLDFGIAKAKGRLQTTREDVVKGKLGYIAPEQLRFGKVTRQTDIYSVGVVLWEALSCRRLFRGETEESIMEQILLGYIDPPSRHDPRVPDALESIALRALDQDPTKRFGTAREMAMALEKASAPVTSDVAAWVGSVAADTLREREERVAAIERAGIVRSDSPPAAWPIPITSAPGEGGTSTSKRRRRLAGAVAFAALVGVLAFAAGTRTAPERTREATKASPSSETPATTASAASLASEAVPPDPPAGGGSATTTLETSFDLPAPSSRAVGARRPTPLSAAPKDDCRTKFTIDDTGKKIYKRNCL
jgi:eukaryotic-like serine/threonine-protein kinase